MVSPLPEGFLKGQAIGTFLQTVVKFVPWLGKTFDRSKSTGINIIDRDGKKSEEFPFRSWSGKGVRDNQEVFKIDYDIPANAAWLRTVLDEVVQVGEGKYLGKMQFIPFNGVYITLGFFELTK